jgi:hypothetical protein
MLHRQSTSADILCRNSSATQAHEGITCFKEFLETRPTQGVSVQQQSEQIDTFLTDANIRRETNCLALNVLQQINMILARKRRLAANHFEQNGSYAPKVGFCVVPENETRDKKSNGILLVRAVTTDIQTRMCSKKGQSEKGRAHSPLMLKNFGRHVNGRSTERLGQ